MTREYAHTLPKALVFLRTIGPRNCHLWVDLLAQLGAEVSERDIFDALKASPLWRRHGVYGAGDWEPTPSAFDAARARVWAEVVQTIGIDAFTALATRMLERFMRGNYSKPTAAEVARWKATS